MKKKSKISTSNQYSISTKVILSLIFFVFVFLFFKFLLVVPRVQKDTYNNELNNISRTLFLVKEQMKMATKAIKMQTSQEIEKNKEKIVSNIKDLKLKNIQSNKELINHLNNSYISNLCSYKLSDDIFEHKKILGKDLFKKNSPNKLDSWFFFEKDPRNIVQRKRIYLFYNTKLDSNRVLSLGCHIRKLNPNHEAYEKDLKMHIQKNLSLLQTTINSKTTVLWINPNFANNNTVLFNKNKEIRKNNYRISKLSNTNELTTGNLTIEQILKARDKKPLEYKLNGKDVVTWILNLNSTNSTNLYTLIFTVNKSDILKKSNANLFVLLPESLIALVVSVILLLFILKKLFSKIEEKTKELKYSLEDKEVLLKEIHHRVKNNLAKTITLIELQENDIEDNNTKKALIDIKERIFTMELLHRKLYESTSLSHIPLKEYIKDLLHTLIRTYNVNENIKINYNIDKINLNIQTAMPLGLIINELVTNSFKYAFTNNIHPKLDISIIKKDKYLTLSFKDNGKGFDKKLLEKSATLGLKLINTLVKIQLSGTINYNNENGSNYLITMQIKEIL